MNWKQINSGLWKAEEGGYEIAVSKSDVWNHHYWWVIRKKPCPVDELIECGFMTKPQSAKQAAEEAYNKLVK